MFTKAIITQTVYLQMSDYATASEKDSILKKLQDSNSGLCIHEGFVKPDSIQLLTHSAGMCRGAFIQYTAQFEADVCTLYEGMVISECTITEVNAAAGLVGQVYLPLSNGSRIPYITVYLHRDTHLDRLEMLEEVNEQNVVEVVVIGSRFEKGSRQIEATCQLLSRK